MTTLERAKLDILAELPYIELPVSNKPGETILVDGDYDGEWLGSYRWFVHSGGYAVGAREYLDGGKRTYRYLHHLVLPVKPGYYVQHIDGNKLNNRSCNLTYRSYKEAAVERAQSPNRKTSKHGNKHGYRGVVRMYAGGPYYGISRGKLSPSRVTAVQAAREYDKMARATWGERAILNFPHDYS